MTIRYYTYPHCVTVTPKAFHVDNPVQAERSAGYEIHPEKELRSSSTPSELVRVVCVLIPALHSVCTGLSIYKSFGLTNTFNP